MNKILLIAAAGILILLLISAGVFFLTRPKEVPTQNTQGTTFPSSGGTQIIGSSPGVAYMNVKLQNGEFIRTLDFVHNGSTFEDLANPGNYYVAGTNDYCGMDGTCPNAATPGDYTIIYSSQDNSFLIGLEAEPLGEVRKKAEEFLLQTLGISKEEMCGLTYTIGTTSYINETYGGENLGFSFCPGATVLP